MFTIVADTTVANMSDFIVGANEEGYHIRGVNWGRDLREPDVVADIRNVVEGDVSPDGKGTLKMRAASKSATYSSSATSILLR